MPCVCRLITKIEPVSLLYCSLFFFLRISHPLPDSMADTWCICNDQRRSLILFCFDESLDALVLVRSHTHLCDINISILHHHFCQLLFLLSFSCCAELGYCPHLCCL